MNRYFPLLIFLPFLLAMAKVPYYKKPYAIRTVPDYYTAKRPYNVSIQVYPTTFTGSYGLEETVPPDWIVISTSVSDGGVYSSFGHYIDWIFIDRVQRNLKYTLVPSTGIGYIPRNIDGVVSFDGSLAQIKGSTVAYPIGWPTPDPGN